MILSSNKIYGNVDITYVVPCVLFNHLYHL